MSMIKEEAHTTSDLETMAGYDIVDSKDNLCLHDIKPLDQNLRITSSQNEGRNTAYGGSTASDLSTVTVKLEIGNADEKGCNVAIHNDSGPSPTVLTYSGKSDEYKLNSCDTSDSITIGQYKPVSPVRKTVDSENWIKKEPCSPTDPCQPLSVDTIVIQSNVDDVVSGNADLENDIAGKPLYSNNTPRMECDLKRVKSEPTEILLAEHRRNRPTEERTQCSGEFSVTSRPRLKGDFECQVCGKAFVLGSAVKNHMIQSHPRCKDLFALKETANKDLDSDSQIVWFCPRNCKYLTSEYNALSEHLVTCVEPYLLSHRDHNRAGKAQIGNKLHPFEYKKEPGGDVSARDLVVHAQKTGQTSSIPGHTLKHEMQTEDQDCHDMPTCQVCGSVFSAKLQLERHLKDCHEESHIHTHAGQKTFECSYMYCKKKFCYGDRLRAHLRTHTKPFQCIHCDKRFSEGSHLINHIRKHTGEKPFKCSHCDKGFSHRTYVKKHIKLHTEETFKCSHCDKRFRKSHLLNKHIRTHTEEKPFKCSYCDQRFSLNSLFKEHMRTHTGEKPFKCSQCDKGFRHNSHLNCHIRTHTGEKPFKCSHCDKRFSRNNDLNVHIRTHTGEKPFKCSHCDKRFNQNCLLKGHMRTHTGEKPFKCSHCDKRFSKNSVLKVHMRTHTQEDNHSNIHIVIRDLVKVEGVV